jgi:hypothetical protein
MSCFGAQTISIAKAGITTILNSRTSVLAAANPIFGRYDDMKTPGENIDFATTILSRFDMIFLVKDEHNEARDAVSRAPAALQKSFVARGPNADFARTFLAAGIDHRQARHEHSHEPRHGPGSCRRDRHRDDEALHFLLQGVRPA